MIPKILHYTWFSNDPFPKEVSKCIESWHTFFVGWEFYLWDMKKISSIESIWLKESLKEKKWAFASDFVRLYAVYHYGGVYLDTDVLVLRNFDPLLNEISFIGRESSFHLIDGYKTKNFLSSHCFGAKKGNLFIKRCLDYYTGRHFILSNNKDLPLKLRLDTTLLPYIQSELAKTIGYKDDLLDNKFQKCNDLSIYPSYFFDPQGSHKESYCKHLALGSWREEQRIERKLTLTYKIKWRMELLLTKICNLLGYVIIKKT